MIESLQLCKSYGSRRAVDRVTFRVSRGEVVGLVGVNGAGKTTLLRLLGGSLRPDSGEALLGGVSLARDPVEARRRLALVLDAPPILDGLTVDEHLAFVASVYRIPGAGARIDRALDEMGLRERRSDVASTLSRGMRQRLALAIARAHDPDAILLDEPFLGLDPPHRRPLVQWIAARAQDGAAVLVSTHELALLERLCSRVISIEGGRVAFDGPLDAALGRERTLEDAFLARRGDA